VLNENYYSILISAFSLDSKGDIYEYLEDKKQKDIIDDYAIRNGTIWFSYKAKNKHNLSLSDLLREFTELLLKNEYKTVCTECNEARESKFFEVNGGIRILCQKCSGKIKESISFEKNRSSHYGIGLIGALIGATIGSFVWILIGYMGFYASIAGYAIAYASFYGYSLVKGLNSKIGVAINIFSIIFALFLAEYIGITLQILKEYPDVSITQYIYATPTLFSNQEFLSSIIPNLALGLLFAGLGSYKIICSMLENAKNRENLNFQLM
jgi:hypothetical protein